MFNIFCIDYFCQNFPKAQDTAFEDSFPIERIANKETKKQRNKETKKQRNKETQGVLLKNKKIFTKKNLKKILKGGNMKQFFFVFLLIFSIMVYADDCINYSVNFNCNSNQTLLSIDNGQISFTALAKWELNKIEYTVKRGPEILRIDVRKENDYLLFECFYHNKSAHLRFIPADKKFATDNALEFLNFIDSLGTNFLEDIRILLGENSCSSYSNDIISIYNYLTNPMAVRYAVGGMIGLKGSFGGWACYAACWYPCVAGCIAGGGKADDCAMSCGDECRRWCGLTN